MSPNLHSDIWPKPQQVVFPLNQSMNNRVLRIMKNLSFLFLTFFLTFCNPSVATNQDSEPPSHKILDELLKKYVDEEGMVDYKALKSERNTLQKYLATLSSNAPNDDWTGNQKLAYWINAYNAFTLELILEHYPVESIKDIGSSIQIPFVNTPWDIKFINIGREEYDLNNIEHGIIRKQFNEPRIHFALVCAAVSCPKLQNEAYIPEKLDEQLTRAAKEFLANKEKNNIKNADEAELSRIFKWYGGDFKDETSLIGYINQYAPIQLSEDAEYHWELNEQK